MKQSVNGSELTYEPQEQAPSQCRTSPEVSAQHHIGKWGRMHKACLEEVHPDLYWQIPVTVESSAYDKEIKNNVTGSLQTRIRSLFETSVVVLVMDCILFT